MALKRVPAPSPKDTTDAPYYKLKSFCLYYAPDNQFVTSKNLSGRLVDIYRTTKPFLDYINRAAAWISEYCISIVAIPKSSHKERMEQNLNVQDYTITAEEMAAIAGLNEHWLKRKSKNPILLCHSERSEESH